MSKPKLSQQERQRLRALEDLEAGLGRGDAEAAVAAWLRLDPAERHERGSAVIALFRAAVSTAFGRSDWNRLLFWAARADREPRLLEGGEADAASREVRWALMWGCTRAKEWERAARHLESIRGALPPGVGRAMEVFIAARGEPAADALAGLLPRATPTASAARPGQDRPSRARPSSVPPVTAPTQESEVVPRLAELYLAQPLATFASTALGWAGQASGSLGRAILLASARLAAGSLAGGRAGGRSAEAMKLIAQVSRTLEAPRELEQELGWALRAATSDLRAQSRGSQSHQSVRTWVDLAKAAARHPEPREAVKALVLAPPVDFESFPELEWELYRALLEIEVDPGVFLMACLFRFPAPDDEDSKWLASKLEALMDRADGLLQALGALEREQAEGAIMNLGQLPSPDLVERLLERLWACCPDGAMGELLALGVESLLMHFKMIDRRAQGGGSGPIDLEHLLECAEAAGVSVPDDLREGLEDPKARKALQAILAQFGGGLDLMEGPDALRMLTPNAKRVWRRFAPRLVPLNIMFLERALGEADSPAEEAEAMEWFIASRNHPCRILEAMREAYDEGDGLAYEALYSQLLTRWNHDVDALASVLLLSERVGAPRGLRDSLAERLVCVFEQSQQSDATDGIGVPARNAVLEEALSLAHSLLPRGRRKAARKPAARGRKAGSAGSSGKPASAAKPASKGKKAPAAAAPPKGRSKATAGKSVDGSRKQSAAAAVPKGRSKATAAKSVDGSGKQSAAAAPPKGRSKAGAGKPVGEGGKESIAGLPGGHASRRRRPSVQLELFGDQSVGPIRESAQPRRGGRKEGP